MGLELVKQSTNIMTKAELLQKLQAMQRDLSNLRREVDSKGIDDDPCEGAIKLTHTTNLNPHLCGFRNEEVWPQVVLLRGSGEYKDHGLWVNSHLTPEIVEDSLGQTVIIFKHK